MHDHELLLVVGLMDDVIVAVAAHHGLSCYCGLVIAMIPIYKFHVHYSSILVHYSSIILSERYMCHVFIYE